MMKQSISFPKMIFDSGSVAGKALSFVTFRTKVGSAESYSAGFSMSSWPAIVDGLKM